MPRRRLFLILVCLTGLLVVFGATSTLGNPQPTVHDGTGTQPVPLANSTVGQESDDGQVRIVSPTANETFARTDIVPIRLAFENTDVGTLTFGNRSSPQNIEIHVTVRDADGDGTATVYLNPFQIGDGARTSSERDEGDGSVPVGESCESRNVSFDDCEQIVTPDRSRNHGFHTVGNRTELVGPNGAQAVAFGEADPWISGSEGRAVIFPQPYDLRVTSGPDSYRVAGTDSTSQITLKQKQFHDISLFTAPRTGPEAIDPTTAEEIRVGIDQGIIEPLDANATISEDQYAILAVDATGVEGGLHEAALRYDAENASEILARERQNVTGPARHAFRDPDAGLLWLDLSTTPVGPSDLELDPARSVNRVIATTNGTDHYRRYYVFLEPRAGTAVTTNDTRLAPGVQLRTTFEAGWFRDGGNYLQDDFVVSGNVTWQFDSSSLDGMLVDIEGAPETAELGDTVTLRASTNDSSIEQYEWQFGDGTTRTGQRVSHRYNQTGEYTVTLTASTADAVDNETVTIVVEDSENESGGQETSEKTPASRDGATETPTEPLDPTTDTRTQSDNDGSGFGTLVAVVVLLVSGYLVGRE